MANKTVSFADVSLVVEHDGKSVELRLGDFTPLECQAYFDLTGAEIEDAFFSAPRIRLVMPMLWLLARRAKPRLTYAQFAEGGGWDRLGLQLRTTDDDTDDDEPSLEDVTDPEGSAGDS